MTVFEMDLDGRSAFEQTGDLTVGHSRATSEGDFVTDVVTDLRRLILCDHRYIV